MVALCGLGHTLAAHFACRPSLSKSESEEGWSVVLNGFGYDNIWQISPQGVKLENTSWPYLNYVAKAPDFTLFIYNNASKTYVVKTKQTWTQQWRNLLKPTYTKGFSATIAGMKTTQYTTPIYHERLKPVLWVECYAANLGLPAELSELIDCLQNATGVGPTVELRGFVLQTAQVDAKGVRKYQVRTKSCKRCTIQASVFQVLQGYRQGAIPGYFPDI